MKRDFIKAGGSRRAHIIASEPMRFESGNVGYKSACSRKIVGAPIQDEPHPTNICKNCLWAVKKEGKS